MPAVKLCFVSREMKNISGSFQLLAALLCCDPPSLPPSYPNALFESYANP